MCMCAHMIVQSVGMLACVGMHVSSTECRNACMCRCVCMCVYIQMCVVCVCIP